MNRLIATIRRHRNAIRAAHQAHSRLVELDPFNPKCAHYLRALADAADASRLVRRLYSYSTPAEMRTEADEIDPIRSTP